LESLQLQLPKNMPIRDKPVSIKVSDIGTLLSRLPCLKLLEMNPKLLIDNSGGTSFYEILEEVQDLRKKFTSTDIRIVT
jgi:hypothetical protein